MAIREILTDIESDGNQQKSAEARLDSDKLIVHFQSINQVDESKFNGEKDPLVVYRTKGKNEIVSVLPFKDGQEDKELLSFAEKIQYFRVRKLDLQSGVELEVKQADETTTTLMTVDYGTFEDFYLTFVNPTDIGLTSSELFDGLYLDLKPESVTEMQAGITAGLL